MCLAISNIATYVGLGVGAPVSNVGTGDTEGLGVVGAGVGRIVGVELGRGVGRAVRNNSSVAAPHSGPQFPGPVWTSNFRRPTRLPLLDGVELYAIEATLSMSSRLEVHKALTG